ncbi:hypothetical protein CLOHYLEM_06677 [[Clostridium] hylemonae DSM 15053]|uniref:Uncharacterized protein n=1 Tax=[Clostridium] hylemonae DSM 15053 TaxID=553973 RepID=C0C3L5_9FIRM|nr:hypothetical protein CLOHYLEM_06677 [[Clostridium] hylemonae DSM 15053]
MIGDFCWECLFFGGGRQVCRVCRGVEARYGRRESVTEKRAGSRQSSLFGMKS